MLVPIFRHMDDAARMNAPTAAPTDEMLALARSRTAADRERLLMAVAELCDRAEQSNNGQPQRPEVQNVLQEIFLNLVREAETDLRQKLAQRLSHAAWAPHGLVVVLAMDEIEIARPIIAASPVLTEDDLLRLLIEATLEHKIEVARRPRISELVIEAIIEESEPMVLAALAANQTAEIGVAQLTRMVASSRRLAALRSPLVRHPRLTVDLAYTLYAWVGDALRRSLLERFRVDEDQLKEALAETVKAMRVGGPDAHSLIAAPSPDDELESQLITKLDAAGQLRPGYLLRSLREGKLSLFKAALTRLGHFDRAQIDAAIDTGRADLLALACSAVGIDRSVFPTIFALVTDLMGRRHGSSPSTATEISTAFSVPPEAAARIFAERLARYQRPAT